MSTRILCLGNDLLGDDAVGPGVARMLRELHLGGLEIVETPESGFYLLDCLMDCDRLVVVDTVVSGQAPPGTVRLVREGDLELVPGSSPHYVGVFEMLNVGRSLGLHMPATVTIICVEAKDMTTVGAGLTAEVEAALPQVISLIRDAIA